jgi:predicted RNA-binding protein with PUA-like domain
MAAGWILKTEPSSYSYDQLEREQTAVWDGVKNPWALKNMAAMRVGDPVLIYHTGNEKACVGRAEVTRAAYPDPRLKDPAMLVVELRAAGRLAKPVTLAAIKADPFFEELALVRQGRLSVVPASKDHFERLLAMSR